MENPAVHPYYAFAGRRMISSAALTSASAANSGQPGCSPSISIDENTPTTGIISVLRPLIPAGSTYTRRFQAQ